MTTQPFDNAKHWQDLYKEAAEEGNDFAGEVRSAVAYGMTDPEETRQIACAAAETSEATVQALSHEWALYTPQDAATVASALFVQLQHNAEAFDALRRAIRHMAERGEVAIPPDSAGLGESANLADALHELSVVANEVDRLVSRYAPSTVQALHAAEGTADLPGDAHETIVAVAALLTEQYDGEVTLKEQHGPGEYDPEDDHGCGCGCSITVMAGGERYIVSHGDSEWTVIREGDGREGKDGIVYFSKWDSLSTSLDTAHPQQLANDVLRIVIP